MSQTSLLRRVFGGIWNTLTRIRMALSNILFLIMIGVIYFVYIGPGPEPLPEKAALLLNPMGSIVDEKSPIDPLQAFLGEPSPVEHEVLLRDVIEAIELGRDDDSINSMVMDLGYLMSVGISKTQEIAVALESFSAAGKPIVAVGDYYTQGQYLLATYADEIIAHPFGGVALEGFSTYQNYFAEALEKLSVNVHVFRTGKYKSAVEPLLRNDMSTPEREAAQRWLDDLWSQYTNGVELRRNLPAGAITDYINGYATRLEQHGGDSAKDALQAGLVDQLLSRANSNDYLADMVGARNETGQFEAVPFEQYLSRTRPSELLPATGSRVAVITAQGNMLPGEQPPGTIGGDSLAKLIKVAGDTAGIKAIVLRINSGGGSVFASEVIRQRILRVRAEGTPVVVSMGSVAASGGYYIAAEADEIWATPSTLTGSIGVFAAFPTFEDLLQRAGVSTDGVGTTELAGSLRVDRALNPQLKAALTASVVNTYNGFITLVAGGRDMSMAEVEAVAQGRVWSAKDALAAGLVDGLGTLQDAIEAAASIAELNEYTVEYLEQPLSPTDLFLAQLAKRVGSDSQGVLSGQVAQLVRLAQPILNAASEVANLQDPKHLYSRCLDCAALN